MAYINCKKCGCQMSDKSEACPLCGMPVGDYVYDNEKTNEEVSSSISPSPTQQNENEVSQLNQSKKVLSENNSIITPGPSCSQSNPEKPVKKSKIGLIIGIVAGVLVIAVAVGYLVIRNQHNAEVTAFSDGQTDEERWNGELEKAKAQLIKDLSNHQYDWIYGTWDINGDKVKIDKDYVYIDGKKQPFKLYCMLEDPYCDELDYGIYTYINGVHGVFVDKSMQTLYTGNEFFTIPCEKVLDGTVSATTISTTTPNEQSIVGHTYTVNSVSFVMKEVNGGTFQMGRNDTDSQWERPAHSVTVSSFNIGETEVTQGLWIAVMGQNPSRYKGNDLPVDDVSYNDIVNEFLPKLNQLTGKNFRLPTEAEWEFAARGGNYSKGYQYAGSSNLNEVAWYWQNTGDTFLGGTDDNWDWNTISNNNGSTRNVKGKLPNELGIYGMSGNVWEWCSDEWHAYKSVSENNPKYYGNNGSSRVLRGGCWCSRTGDCRVTFRCGKNPDEHFPKWGFRLALTQ